MDGLAHTLQTGRFDGDYAPPQGFPAPTAVHYWAGIFTILLGAVAALALLARHSRRL